MAKTGPKGPWALNDIVEAKIIGALKRGNMRSTACQLARVNPNAIAEWMRQDKEPYLSFCQKVRDAEAFAVDAGLERIKEGSSGWQGMAWWLERRDKKWSKEVAAAKAKNAAPANSNELEDVELDDLMQAIQDAAALKAAEEAKKDGTNK